MYVCRAMYSKEGLENIVCVCVCMYWDYGHIEKAMYVGGYYICEAVLGYSRCKGGGEG